MYSPQTAQSPVNMCESEEDGDEEEVGELFRLVYISFREFTRVLGIQYGSAVTQLLPPYDLLNVM